MKESLRDQQRRLAQDRIIQAAAEELVEAGLSNLSVPAVAERAGVSLRTVYNHFESKEVLLDSIVAAADARFDEIGAVDIEPNLQLLPDAIKKNWRLFGELGVLGQAMSLIVLERATSAGHVAPPARNQGMTAALRAGLHDLDPSMSKKELDAILSIVRLLVSYGGWHRLTNEFGIDTTTSGTTVAWAFATLRDAIARGEGPFADA